MPDDAEVSMACQTRRIRRQPDHRDRSALNNKKSAKVFSLVQVDSDTVLFRCRQESSVGSAMPPRKEVHGA